MSGKEFAEKVLQSAGKAIIGRDEVIRRLLAAMLSDGHVLLEDVPGTGKTRLARTMAKILGLECARIQFTPDLLPSDITGMNIYDRQKNEFVLRKGPVFTNILLADEINRATPRTQAGLLECMEERQITIDGVSYAAGDPFFVIATQNPVETAGTFPLPEAQLDRFMMKLSMGLPDRAQEIAILDCYQSVEKDPLKELQSVFTKEQLKEAKRQTDRTYVHSCIREYIASLAEASRKGDSVSMGVSPRGSLALLRCAKAYAWLNGRAYVLPDDIRLLAVPVLAHRIVLNQGYQSGEDTGAYIEKILAQVPVPTEDFTV